MAINPGMLATFSATDPNARPVVLQVAPIYVSWAAYMLDATQVTVKTALSVPADVYVCIVDAWIRVDTLFAGGVSAAKISVGLDGDSSNSLLTDVLVTTTGLKALDREFKGDKLRNGGTIVVGTTSPYGSDVIVKMDAGAGALCSDIASGLATIYISYYEVPISGAAAAALTTGSVADPGASVPGFVPVYTFVNFADSPFTIRTTDEYIDVDTSGGATTVNLPPATLPMRVTIKHSIGAPNVVLTPDGGDTIDLVGGPVNIVLSASRVLYTAGDGDWRTE